MKKVVMMACAALLAVSCGGDKKAEIKQMSGFVDGGTSMHVLVVDPIGGDAARQSFALDDATDLKEAYGLLEGNVVMVDYKAAGEGVMPDPVREGEVMGVELRVGGKAQSINMATLPYASWELQGEPGKLILHGQSIGNGQTIDVTDTAVLGENGGVPTLTIEGSGVVYTRAE